MLKILEIGCGKSKYKSKKGEVIGLDIVKLPGVDVVHNLNEVPYPFIDSEFDLIIANHVLEHLEDLVIVMEELCRILKPNGILRIIVPYFSSPLAFQDPTHKKFFSLVTFDYFTENSAYKYYSSRKCSFKIIKKTLVPFDSFLNNVLIKFMNKYQHFYEAYFYRLIIPKELEIILKKIA